MADDDDDEEGRTLIAAPMPGGAWHSAAPDALPDEDQTLIAMPAAYLRPQAPQPRPAAGLPPATPPPQRLGAPYPMPRPAAGYPPAAYPQAAPPQAYPAQPYPAQAYPAQPPPAHPGFTPIDRTLEMPRVAIPAYPSLPASAPPAFAVPQAPAPPLSSGEMVLAAPPEGMPAIVVLFLLVCGLVTALGLLALIYLQL